MTVLTTALYALGFVVVIAVAVGAFLLGATAGYAAGLKHAADPPDGAHPAVVDADTTVVDNDDGWS